MQVSLPATMRQIVIDAPGEPDVMRIGEAPLPRCGPGQVLIEVDFAGVNRPDVQQRRGRYPAPKDASPVLGLEVAGRIVAVGEGVTDWTAGDEACALTHGGGYAGYVAVDAGHCLPVPSGMSLLEAAALPENFFTVWSNVFTRGGLKAGESLLVHGGSSGIGLTAIQLARAFGATTYATVGNSAKAATCLRMGATATINYREEDFAEATRKLTDERGVDMVLDMVGAPYLARNIGLLATGGRLVHIAVIEGAEASLDIRQILKKRLTLTGSTLRPQSAAAKSRIAAELRDQVWPLLGAERIRPVIHQTFDLADACEAHRLMESSLHIGKIMLQVKTAA